MGPGGAGITLLQIIHGMAIPALVIVADCVLPGYLFIWFSCVYSPNDLDFCL